jgi:hypothetical protein
MVIDQSDVNLVAVDQDVKIKIDQLPNDTIDSKVAEIAPAELKEVPKRLSTKFGGEVPIKTDPITGVETLQSPSYQADASIDDENGYLRIGLRGTARIYTRWTSIGERSWRFLMNTFNFKL